MWRMRIWPGPGSPTGRSTSRISSGPPCRSMTTVRAVVVAILRLPWIVSGRDPRGRPRRVARQATATEARDGRVVARGGDLPGLSALLSGRFGRWPRRSARHHPAARPCRLAGRRRDLAVADLPLAHEGHGLRRLGLLRDRPALRDARGFRPAGRRRRMRLGLKVIIDQVLSHTSDQHPWFMESRMSKDNAKADWYVWADPLPDGIAAQQLARRSSAASPGSGRRGGGSITCTISSSSSRTSTSTIRRCRRRCSRCMRFWLERGVDGFRLDTVNFYIHDKRLALQSSGHGGAAEPAAGQPL